MNGVRQGWLVAVREMRERGRSRAFRASVILMIVVVAGVIILPGLLNTGGGTKGIGLTGSVPAGLTTAIQAESEAANVKVHLVRYQNLAAGEQAVRNGDVVVLVVDAQRLEWRRQTDQQLRATVTAAVQLLAVQGRAATAGISPSALAAVLAPVPVKNVQLGSVAGRSPNDEAAATIMTILLFIAVSTYGSLVLTGVVEEKTTRVVEVLLARMPARSLLAGKVAGIGLLGLAQIGVTALVALVATAMVKSIDLPAARASVLSWVVVWFALGYALYAMAYGALGSLASRTEDAQSVAGPVLVTLIVAYFVSLAAAGQPDSTLAKTASYFPPTAPFAMPTRIAMGATAWWEPLIAAALTAATIVGLVFVGGRVYAGAILHTGPSLKLRDALRFGSTADTDSAGMRTSRPDERREGKRRTRIRES